MLDEENKLNRLKIKRVVEELEFVIQNISEKIQLTTTDTQTVKDRIKAAISLLQTIDLDKLDKITIQYVNLKKLIKEYEKLE